MTPDYGYALEVLAEKREFFLGQPVHPDCGDCDAIRERLASLEAAIERLKEGKNG